MNGNVTRRVSNILSARWTNRMTGVSRNANVPAFTVP